MKTFLFAAGQLKVYDVGVFNNKCWYFLLTRTDSVVKIVAGLGVEKLRNRVTIPHKESHFFNSPKHADRL